VNYPKAPPESSLGVLFETLAKAGIEYAGATHNGGRFYCPIHPDDNPSFDVTLGRNGKAVFRCSPCAAQFGQEQFWQALRARGIGWMGESIDPSGADTVTWGDRKAPSKGENSDGGAGVPMRLATTYLYKSENGKSLYRVRRFEETDESFTARSSKVDKPIKRKKRFRPERFDPIERKWLVGLVTPDGEPSVERVPYGLEHFDGWKGLPLVVVEGEKACEALWAASVPATTWHGGADAPVPTDWFARFGFDRFKAVWGWADRDAAGVALMERLGAGLPDSAGWEVYVAPEPYGKGADAADVLANPLGGSHGSPRRKDLERVTPELAASLAPAPPQTPAPAPEGRSEAGAGLPVTLYGGKPLVGAGGGSAGVSGGAEGSGLGEREQPYPRQAVADPRAVVLELLARHFGGRFARLRYFGGDRYGVWDEAVGHFRRFDGEQIDSVLDAVLEGARETTPDGVRPLVLTPRSLAGLTKMLRVVTTVADDGPGSLRDLRGHIPFHNGVLDVTTRELSPAEPTWNLWWSLPFDWTGEKERCSAWLGFLASIGFERGTEEHRFLQQVFGYVLAGRGDLHKLILLVGPTRAGKGTVLRVLHALLGDGAVGLTLDSFAQQFGLQQVVGAGAVTIGDARFARTMDKAVIERLLSISGGDPMPVDVKYGKPKTINFELGGRVLIATNETPSFLEASNAMADRFAVLKFTRSFLGREDLNLEKALMGELPGIVRWALAGLDDLGPAGHFAEPASGVVVREQIKSDSAPIRLFIEERCELGPEFKVPNEELYLAYSRWAELNGMFKMNAVHFARDLLTAFDGQIVSGKTSGKKVKRGVRLRG